MENEVMNLTEESMDTVSTVVSCTKGKGKKVGFIAGGVAAIAMAGVGIYFLVKKIRNRDEEDIIDVECDEDKIQVVED